MAFTPQLILLVCLFPSATPQGEAPLAKPRLEWRPLPVVTCGDSCYPFRRRSTAAKSSSQPQYLAPWLRDARAVNRWTEEVSFDCKDLDSIAGAMRKLTGKEVIVSDGLREAGTSSMWWCGSGQGLERPCVVLRGLEHTPYHPRWSMRDGKITLISASEFEGECVRADADPGNAALADLRARVRVHWDEAVLHEAEYRVAAGEISRRKLVLQGRTTFIDDRGREVPLYWPLSAAVAISMRPDINPDWSTTPASKDTCVWWTAAERGTFCVHLALDQIERVPGGTRDFKIGVCLPDFEPGGTWRRTAHVLPQSIASIAIAGPPVLDQYLSAINACVANDWRYSDPVALVRAVNLLRGLGKQQALEVLRQYSALVASEGFAEQTPSESNADHGNSACILWIVRLLFDFDAAAVKSIALEVDHPGGLDRGKALNGFRMATGMVAASPYDVESYPGNQYPFVVVDDLPFFAPVWLQRRTGSDPGPIDAIEWAEVHGTIRASALRPSDDPLGVVKSLRTRVGPLPAGNDPGRQIWNALSHLIGPPPESSDIFVGDDGNPVSSLRSLRDGREVDLAPLERALAAHSGVHWDEAAQRYALGARGH